MKLAIIGNGNVGPHLGKALRDAGHEVKLLPTAEIERLTPDCEVVLLTVRDSAIPSVAAKVNAIIPSFSGILAHTAGSVPVDVLSPYARNYGVFYPMQTFSRQVQIADYRPISLFIEGNSPETVQILSSLASSAFDSVTECNGERRKTLHLASVFACNFTNALWTIASDILQADGLDFSALHPLLKQTLEKALSNSPLNSQTGPAVRNDNAVMDAHLASLAHDPEKAKIYRLLSDYIINRHSHEQN
ncbi:MAG: DUF2520 domain-containing protein [Muribaculaceae bacterium]|nr:DUF2520 domain-containing protein [Muribaculaceae bacterium]